MEQAGRLRETDIRPAALLETYLDLSRRCRNVLSEPVGSGTRRLPGMR